MNKQKGIAAVVAACLVLSAFTALAEGSWGQINQPVERPESWQAFVEDSVFILGEKVELGEVNGQTIYEQAYGTYPSLDGSTVAVPMGMELARQLLGMAEGDLAGFVTFSTTHSAYERLIGQQPNPSPMVASGNIAMEEAHPVDLILATEPSDEELQMAAEAGVELIKEPFCYDAFVFFVNAQNPVDNLTMEQIREIYTGQVLNWVAVGGKDALIIPFQREKNSGSQTAMENLVMLGVPMAGTVDRYVSGGMGDLVRQIGDYDNGEHSIGYSYLYYLDNLYKSGNIKVLSVDGVAPTPENLRSGAYPLTTSYYAVYRKGEEAPAAFTEWLLSDVGQKCVGQAGYVSLP